MSVVSFKPSPLEEDTLIDALRSYVDAEELFRLRDQLAKNPENPPLFDWVCSLHVRRRVSRVLAARVLKQLHYAAPNDPTL